MIIKGLIYINIFVNLTILGSYFFPNVILQIPYQDRVVAESLSSLAALQFKQEFYLLAPFYDENFNLINRLMMFLGVLGALVTIFNCFMILNDKLMKLFLLVPVLIFLLWDVIFPPGLDHWGFRFLYNVTDIINCILFGFLFFNKK